MKPFVGVKQVSSQTELKKILQNSSQPSYYFLRSPEQVSGIITEITEITPEGQMFNSQSELRWQQRGSGYEILLLSKVQPDSELKFTAIGGSWQIVERNAHFYLTTETRFPKALKYRNIKISQRYFMDSKTATVHFVALTVTQ